MIDPSLRDRYQPELSLVLPVYNAVALIRSSVEALRDFCKTTGKSYEILLCDDASSDGSGRLLQQLAHEIPEVRVFQNKENGGLGRTLRTLFSQSSGEYVVYCDMDLPFGVHGIKTVLSALAQADIVVASRYRDPPAAVPLSRRLLSRMYYGLCQLLFKIKVRDIGSGTVGLHREALRQLDLQANGFDIHLDLFYQAGCAGLRMQEIGVPAAGYVPGSFRVWPHGYQVLGQTLRLFWKSKIRRDFKK